MSCRVQAICENQLFVSLLATALHRTRLLTIVLFRADKKGPLTPGVIPMYPVSLQTMSATEVQAAIRSAEQEFGTVMIGFLAKRNRKCDSLTQQDVRDAISYTCAKIKAASGSESKSRFQYDWRTGKPSLQPAE